MASAALKWNGSCSGTGPSGHIVGCVLLSCAAMVWHTLWKESSKKAHVLVGKPRPAWQQCPHPPVISFNGVAPCMPCACPATWSAQCQQGTCSSWLAATWCPHDEACTHDGACGWAQSAECLEKTVHTMRCLGRGGSHGSSDYFLLTGSSMRQQAFQLLRLRSPPLTSRGCC